MAAELNVRLNRKQSLSLALACAVAGLLCVVPPRMERMSYGWESITRIKAYLEWIPKGYWPRINVEQLAVEIGICLFAGLALAFYFHRPDVPREDQPDPPAHA